MLISHYTGGGCTVCPVGVGGWVGWLYTFSKFKMLVTPFNWCYCVNQFKPKLKLAFSSDAYVN